MKRDVWAEFLTAETLEEFEELEKNGGIIAEAVRKLRTFSQEEGHRYWPMIVEKLEMEMKSNRESDQQLAIEKGREEGFKIGIMEAKKKIALNMLSLGLDVKIISEATKLSQDEIEKLE